MPPKKSKKKKSVERGSKTIAKGNDNQQQIVNVTVNIPRERKKKDDEEKKKPKIDPQAVQQLEGSVQQYQALVKKAKEAGIKIPPELELDINAGDIKTTQDVLALNKQVTQFTDKLSKMLEAPQGASGFDQMPHSLVMGIGGVPQMRARPGFNPASGYDNPDEDGNTKKGKDGEKEKEKDKDKTPALPDPTPEPNPADPPTTTTRDLAHAFVGLVDRPKPLPSFVNQGNSALFMNFFRRVTVPAFGKGKTWKDLYTSENLQANRDNGATSKDIQLAWIYSVAIRFLTNEYPKIIQDDGGTSTIDWDDTFTHESGFETFYSNLATFLGPNAPEKSVWNRLPVAEYDTAPQNALDTMKSMFFEDVASLKDEPFYQSNASTSGGEDGHGGMNQIQGQLQDTDHQDTLDELAGIQNDVNDLLNLINQAHSPPRNRPNDGSHGASAHDTPRQDESTSPQQGITPPFNNPIHTPPRDRPGRHANWLN